MIYLNNDKKSNNITIYNCHFTKEKTVFRQKKEWQWKIWALLNNENVKELGFKLQFCSKIIVMIYDKKDIYSY